MGHDLVGIVHHNIRLLLEAFQNLLVGQFSHVVELHRLELLGCEGHLHSHDFEEAHTATFIVVVLEYVADTVPNHVADVHAESLADEGVATLLVDDRTLLVHHVIVFQQVLTHAEVVLLHLLLRVLDAAGNHAVLDHLAVLEAKAVHHLGDTFAGEESHQLVLDADEEDAAAWVALTTGTSAKLTVHAAAFVALCADDGKSACCLHVGRELDVRTTACHVGSDGHSAEQALVGLYEFGGIAWLALFLLGRFCLYACLIIHCGTLLVEGSPVGSDKDSAHRTLSC